MNHQVQTVMLPYLPGHNLSHITKIGKIISLYYLHKPIPHREKIAADSFGDMELFYTLRNNY